MKELNDFFNELEKPSFNRLYISVVKRFFALSKEDSLDIIEILSDLDILKPVYKIKIHGKLQPGEYEYLRNIPQEIFIEDLYEDVKIDYTKDVFLLFKVIKDE